MGVRLALLAAAVLASYARAEDAYVEGEVLVTFKPEVQEPRARAALKDRTLGLTSYFDRISKRRQRVSGLVRNTGRTTAQLLADLKADPAVESVEPNYLRRFSALIPSDPGFSKLWGLRNTGQRVNSVTGVSGIDVRFTDAWALARPSAGEVVVGVVDSGVDISHPDLAGNIWTNPLEIEGNDIDDDANGFVDDIHGYDFAGHSASLSDSGEHGTHVAGTIAAVGENGLGVIGVQFRSKLLPLKVSNDGDSMATSAVLAAFDYAIALKERGVNLVALNASFGGSSFSNTEKAAIEALGSAGIILCAAAGNDGTNNEGTPVYPASYAASNIIVVAALDQSGELAGYSNFGATTVDLAAPGSNIYSTLPLERASPSTAFKVGSLSYSAVALEYSGQTSLAGTTAPIVPCGLGRPEDFPGSTAGGIALIGRGTLNFSDKVRNAMNAGAVAVVIYDNTTSSMSGSTWTLGDAGSWIPAVGITRMSGQTLLASALPSIATVIYHLDPGTAFQYLDWTSMAAPHVTGAVAFAAWNFPAETMANRISRVLGNVTTLPSLSGKVLTGGTLNLLKIVDTDTDSLPDWWEQDFFGDLAQPANGDPDHDGLTNAQEFLAAGRPTVPEYPLPALAARIRGGTRDFAISFGTVAGRVYQVESSHSLEASSWQALGLPMPGTGGTVEVTDPAAVESYAQRFYRLRVVE
jgi:subtilisin family serine protease